MRKHVLRENSKGETSKYKTEVSLNIYDNQLKCVIKAYDSNFYTPYENFNEPIYEGCCVEIFIMEKENQYLEIEIAPNGAQFIAIVDVDECGKRKLTFQKDMVETSFLIDGSSYEVTFTVDLKKYFKNINELKCNVYRIENKKDEEQYLMSLNPTLLNTFHSQSSFISIGDII